MDTHTPITLGLSVPPGSSSVNLTLAAASAFTKLSARLLRAAQKVLGSCESNLSIQLESSYTTLTRRIWKIIVLSASLGSLTRLHIRSALLQMIFNVRIVIAYCRLL